MRACECMCVHACEEEMEGQKQKSISGGTRPRTQAKRRKKRKKKGRREEKRKKEKKERGRERKKKNKGKKNQKKKTFPLSFLLPILRSSFYVVLREADQTISVLIKANKGEIF